MRRDRRAAGQARRRGSAAGPNCTTRPRPRRCASKRTRCCAELDEIAVERADGLLTGAQAKIATDRITEKLAAIERRQQDQERLRVFDGLPLGRPEVADAVERLSPDRLRAVLAVLMTVTVAPVGKGGHVFDPERVQVNWR